MPSIQLYAVPVDENFEDGMLQPSVVVNTNARRAEVSALPALDFEATEPGGPNEGDLVVLSAAWLSGEAGEFGYFYDETWLFFIPFEGMRKFIGGVEHICEIDSSGVNWSTLVSTLGNYADDAAAAIGLVPVGGEYRTGSIRKLRVA